MKNKRLVITVIVSLFVVVAIFLYGRADNQEVLNNSKVTEVVPESVSDTIVEQNKDIVSTSSNPVTVTESTVAETKPVVIEESVSEPVKPSGITMAEVRAHADASSCWSAINGVVYDLTLYIPKHPGGKGEILAICGRDGSGAFDGQHGGESKPERILVSYKIDNLSN